MRFRPLALPASSVALAVALLSVAACTGGKSGGFIPPPPASVAKITTAPPGSDFTGVPLEPVPGRQRAEPVEVLGGESVLGGVILGPDGPVAGATVRLERFVGDDVGRIDVTSNGDGTWRAPQPPRAPTVPTVPPQTVPGQPPTIPPTTRAAQPAATSPARGPQGLLGGRYRVRAWRSPDLALTTPQILFVEAKQNKQLPLQLSRYTGISVSSVSSPDPPVLDAPVSLTAVVTSLSVDSDGVVRSVPAPGASVTLTAGAGFAFSGGPAVTNGQGRATFQLVCQATGQSQVELTVNQTETFTVPIRPCVEPAPTTTTTLPSADPTGPSSSSAVPGSSSTTRSTGPPPT